MMKRMMTGLALLCCCVAATGQVHSVLSEGRWWLLTTEEDGIYRLTTSNLPALQGVSVDSLAVYGRGSGMLSVYNSQTSTGDLVQVATEVHDLNGNGRFDTGDELLFYGEGAERWLYSPEAGRWIFEHHSYARANHYYLTTTAHAPKRIATADVVSADMTLTTFTVVDHVDNDLVNMYQSGQLWMGEKFSTALTQRTFELRLPGTSHSDVKLRYAVASTAPASFTMSTADFSRQTSVNASSGYSTETATLDGSASTYVFTLKYFPTEGAASGYLDYIELNAHAAVAFNGGQMVLRDESHPGPTAAFRISGNTSARVWEVTHTGAEREMAVVDGQWTDSTATARKYIAFDNYSYLSPTRIETLSNQDLHGSGPADLVIVSHPDFLKQARRVATLHEVFDTLLTMVATDAEVYNEFSSGKQDPMAIRALLRWMNEQHPSRPPRYLILFGQGSYDPRGIEGDKGPLVVTYETTYSFAGESSSYASDDMMGYLGPNERGLSTESLDVSIGRLPAGDTTEANHIVDKLEGYMTLRDLEDEGNRGDWRNYVALLADDADPGQPGDSLFAHSSEVIATTIKQTLPQLNIDRIYADSYHQESGAIGSYYPDLNNALRQRMNYGCLLLNYIGHGSTAYIGTERFIELSNIASYSNTDRLPLFVTSTCSYGRFDLPQEQCGAEACLLAEAGMIGVISASRPISHNERFNKDVVIYALNPQNTIGDALRLAKNRTAVSLSIGLIGDPALRLSQPTNRVKVTHINQEEVCDTTDVMASVLSRVTVSGEIVDADGQLIDDFDGTVYPVVYDREMRTTTLANDNPGTEVTFWQQKSVLYKGSHAVNGGRFEYTFIVPQDVSYRYDYAKLSHYAKSGLEHATGSFGRLMLGGMSDSSYSNASAPNITLYLGDTNFRPGAITGPDPMLVANIFDSAGINIGTGLGHDITAVVDDNPNSLIVLNDFYQQDIADSRRGSVSYTLQGLTPGRHTVTVKAWNIFGLSATATVPFVVHGADSLVFSELSCVPNPAVDVATFSLRVNKPAGIASAELQIYNSHGQLMLSHTPSVSADGFIVGPVGWNVGSVPPGLYLARMVISDTEGVIHQVTTKCIVR